MAHSDAPAVTVRPNQRERILDVALALMSEHGSSKTSMRQLAGECGLNVAAIYHYFESKDELLRSVIAERQYGTRIQDVPQIDPSDPLPDRLAAIYYETWRGAIEEAAVWRLLLGEGIRGEPAAIEEGRSLLELFHSGLNGWLERAAPDVADHGTVADLMIGQLFAGFVRQIFEPDRPTDDIAQESINTVLRALDMTT